MLSSRRAFTLIIILFAATVFLFGPKCTRRPVTHSPSLVFATSHEVRSGFIRRDGKILPVQYAVVNGRAIFEGDIVLGSADEMALVRQRVQNAPEGQIRPEGFGTTGPGGRWQNNTVPYCISPGLTNPDRVRAAAAEWNNKTTMHIVDAGGICNLLVGPVFAHVNFIQGADCSSPVGMQGGIQNISLAPGCGVGATIHEIGHAVGLWHEQSRTDRDQFVTIIFSNILGDQQHNFNQESGTLLGAYDYGSIMHYGAFDFAIDTTKPTIVTKPPGIPIGQRAGLSAGDIAAVKMLYP
jgi:astacin